MNNVRILISGKVLLALLLAPLLTLLMFLKPSNRNNKSIINLKPLKLKYFINHKGFFNSF